MDSEPEAPGEDSPIDRVVTAMRKYFVRGGLFLGRFSLASVRYLLRAIGYGVVGGLIVLVVVAVIVLNNKPDLAPWHEIELREEFTESSRVSTFPEYLELEERLFTELDERIYEDGGDISVALSRYHRGSLADPTGHETNWNRSFEWKPGRGRAVAGVLLLHGMSDSPYSLLSVGGTLREQGAHVIGLRLPGHGTAPSGMLSFDWEDMAAAVRIAVAHLHEETGGAPLYVLGYSNGGALAVNYALEAIEEDLPVPDGLVLFSPAIGVTPLAALAVWQQRLGHILGLRKLEWNGVAPEYDPYKYVSFSVNAGNQVRRLTLEIGDDLERLREKGRLGEVPSILAFQSVVDATVSTPALIEGLFAELPDSGHELVLFDLNRARGIEQIVKNDPVDELARIISERERSYAISLVTNRETGDRSVEALRYPSGLNEPERADVGLEWPGDLYSLAHVSIPFRPDDPFYGNFPVDEVSEGRLRLGMIALRGERGVLEISPSDQLRLRWNPFYPYLEERVVSFVTDAGAGGR